MSCCAPADKPARAVERDRRNSHSCEEILLASRAVSNGLRQIDLSVPAIHCGGCIQRIESALSALAGVEHARVNLSTKRVAIRWRDGDQPPPFVETLTALGYPPHLLDGSAEEKDQAFSELLRALAVAGFATGNIMLLSVSVWSGAEPATRDLFHWISALIALPTLAYSGRVFFRSAWQAVRHSHTNMDVPISVGVILAFGMSLYDTIHHGQYAYFDAAVSLLFFLLIGRTLDHMMRGKARVAVKGLARLAARGALVMRSDGARHYLPVGALERGMTILLAAGERVPVDARVASGRSDLDCSLVSGESAPQPVAPGAMVRAGTLNLTGPLTITSTAAAKDSFLAEMVRLMEAAEAGRSAYRRIADRAAQLYAPAVHLTALLSFLGWVVATGDAHRAITIAIAVLIITCPCALGLAVPMVQVVAARRLFEHGIMAKDGSAMERLAEIDTVVLDKTGVLTMGSLRLANAAAIRPEHLAIASAIAAHSRHPHARALAMAGTPDFEFDEIAEHPGLGLEAASGKTVYRLGRACWALGHGDRHQGTTGTVLSRDGQLIESFRFEDQIRPGALEAIAQLKQCGLEVEIVSGDQRPVVRQLAFEIGVQRFQAGVLPRDKASRLAALAASGRKALMVGDGLNDAPALAAAHVAIAPATAADVGRNAADFVFLRESLEVVPLTIRVARQAGRLIRQNFALATAYNAVALPIAMLGHVTPLIAALAMSLSSIIVVANALRLRSGRPSGRRLRHQMASTDHRAPLAMEPAG
jgi:P-type Cu2+ transporter